MRDSLPCDIDPVHSVYGITAENIQGVKKKLFPSICDYTTAYLLLPKIDLMLISPLFIMGGLAYAALQGNYMTNALSRPTHSQHHLTQAGSLATPAPFPFEELGISCQMIGVVSEYQQDLFKRSESLFIAALKVTARDTDRKSVEDLFNSDGHTIEFKEPRSPDEFDKQMASIKKNRGFTLFVSQMRLLPVLLLKIILQPAAVVVCVVRIIGVSNLIWVIAGTIS